jgi:YVTN family beta-propeller protein
MKTTLTTFAAAALLTLSLACQQHRATDQTPSATHHSSPSTPHSPLRIYISNERSNDVSVIDPATNAVVATIPVGKRPRGIHVTRDNKSVFVALSGSPIGGPGVKDQDLPPADKEADGIALVDVATGQFKEKLNSGSDPEQFDLSNDERTLYVSNEDESQVSIVDVASRKVTAQLDVGMEPEGVTTTPDGKHVYVTCESENEVHVLDTARRQIVAKFKTAERPRSVAFTPDGKKAYVTCETAGIIDVVDTATLKTLKQIHPTGPNVRPMGVVVSPDGRRAYVTTGRGATVVAINTDTDDIAGTVTNVGARPWGLAITPDGQTLYTANGPSNDVSVIDTKTLSVKTHIKAGTSPWGVAVSH